MEPSATTSTSRTTPSPAHSERDGVIDALRGLCMVSMVTAHTAPHSILAGLLHIPRLVTGLDGFVFLSGYVLGLVDRRRVARYGEAGTARRILHRAGTLYVVQAFFIAATLCWSQTMGGWPEMPDVAERGGWLHYLVRLATFQDGLYRNRLLSMYVCLLVAAPVVLYALRRGRWAVVAAASVAIYAMYWASGRTLWPGEDGGFKPPGWQLLFFGGCMVGYHSVVIRTVAWPRVRAMAIPICAVVVAGFLAVANIPWVWAAFGLDKHPTGPGTMFDTLSLGPARVPYFLCLLVLMYRFIQRVQGAAWYTWPGWLLRTIGGSSLYCFTVHMPFALATVALRVDTWSFLAYEAWAWGTMAVVATMARYRVLGRVIPN